MRVTVEPPEGWGPKQALLTELARLGYAVTEWRVLGRPVFEIRGYA